jgi:hypothetical protein
MSSEFHGCHVNKIIIQQNLPARVVQVVS